MKICYQDINFRDSSMDMIEKAGEIITEFYKKGFDLTLRQLYYLFVARDEFPDDRRWTMTSAGWRKDPKGTKNAEPNYKWLGGLVNDGRLAGLLDWKAIVDRLRKEQSCPHWKSPAEIISASAEQYGIDTRADQDIYIECWIEKDALSGIVEQACDPLDVTWFACRGYVSQSAMWRAAKRILVETRPSVERPQRHAVILHLGDHDPSGINMTDDIENRLRLFRCDDLTVQRIALNMDQIQQYNPPPQPAKIKDSRFDDYVEKFGDDSWELDALEPQVLVDLITKHVDELTDQDKRKALIARQEIERLQLQAISEQWDDVVDEFGDAD